jgi:hypothetical protein
VVVVPDRAWARMRDHVRPDLEIVDSMRIRAHTMLIVRRAAAAR